MKKIFLETSVFIRYFTRDNLEKFNDCLRLFELVEEGRFKPYTSNIVIAEIIFVLIGIYKIPKKKVLSAVEDILNMRNIVLVEKTRTLESVKLLKKLNIKYGDCLIVHQVPGGTILISYDDDFKKIPYLTTSDPAQILNSAQKG